MKKLNLIILLLVVCSIYSLEAQVAINDDGSDAHESAILDVDATTKGVSFPNVPISNLTNPGWPIFSPKIGLVVYNTHTGTGPGLFMWTGIPPVTPDGLGWISLSSQGSSSPGSFESVTLTTDDTISTIRFDVIPNMPTLNFTAVGTSVLINFTASGNGGNRSLTSSTSVDFRIMTGETGGSSLGGTNTQIKPPIDWSSAEWNVSFSKEYSGLTPGTPYKIRVEGYVYGGSEPFANIRANSRRDTDHLTLSIIQ